jgi:hypothetical protein
MAFRRFIVFALAACWMFSGEMLSGGVIRLKNREIRTSEEPSDVREPVNRMDVTRRHVVVEFDHEWSARTLNSLRDRGISVTSALGSHALMLGVDDNESLDGLGVSWRGELRARDKLSPEIGNPRIAPAGFLVEFHNDVPITIADQIIEFNRLTLLPTSRLLPNQRLVQGTQGELQRLAAWDEVAYVFPGSKDLASSDAPHPCYGALVQGLMAADYVTEGTGWANRNAFGAPLQYVFTNLTDKVPASEVQTEILRAMHSWSAISNVTFTAGINPSATGTVAIEFGASINGDPTPFDPAGNILAHTYYPDPPNPEPIAGDMHFNPSVNWNVGAATDIYTVALHELGHALGLGHTDNPADVMYPYYRFGSQLSSNDIAGVQALYGIPGGSVPVPLGGGSNPGGSPVAPTSPLSLLISSPTNGLITSATTTTLSGSLANASGPSTVVWRSSSGATGNASGSPAWTTTDIPLIQGINLITITATDGPQQTAAALLRILQIGVAPPPIPVTLNPPPPNPPPPATALLTISTPLNGINTTAASVAIAGTSSAPSGIAQVTWMSNSGQSGTATGTTSWSIPLVALYPGENQILVYALSNSGSTQWNTVEITRN